MKVIVFTIDLLDRSKIEGTLRKLNLVFEIHDTTTSFNLDDDNLYMVNLALPSSFDIIKKVPNKCIAYGPHTQTELFKKAHELGCKNALPRSAFFANMEKVIALFMKKQ